MPTFGWVLLATISWGLWAFALRRAVGFMPPLAAQIAYGATMLAWVPLYVLLAKLYWFSVPFRGIVASTVCYVAALALAWM